MKASAIPLLLITTLLLLVTVILASMNAPFSYVFFATCVGQILIVYTILKYDYKTDKTFKDFYEDRPDLGQ